MARRLRIAGAIALLALAACGTDYDSPSEVRGLRILAVQKDEPYAAPGEDVTLRMLWADGSTEKPREDVEIRWFGGCYNPPGDLYQGCFPHVAVSSFLALGGLSGRGADGGAPAGGAGIPPNLELPGGVGPGALAGLDFHLEELTSGTGNEFHVRIPRDVITRRDPPHDRRVPHYGLSYVFFTACAGELRLLEDFDFPGFPFACFSKKDGSRLGQEDFVVGYSAIYAYDHIRNENPKLDPKVDGFDVEGTPYEAECVGVDCLDQDIAAIDADLGPKCPREGTACIDACADDGEETCKGHDIRVHVDPDSAELDKVTQIVEGATLTEQMWVNYYVDRGEVGSDARLVNDATKGFNPETETAYRAPKAKGPARLWAVVHDNRGGVTWARLRIVVK